jgi:hypothetical protein
MPVVAGFIIVGQKFYVVGEQGVFGPPKTRRVRTAAMPAELARALSPCWSRPGARRHSEMSSALVGLASWRYGGVGCARSSGERAAAFEAAGRGFESLRARQPLVIKGLRAMPTA